MKSRLLLLTVLAFVTALLAFRIREIATATLPIASFNNNTKKKIIRCGPDWNQLNEWLAESDIPPIPGAGNHHWTITTSSDSAQFYFNQGMNMYYSFHIIEAMASFKKAVRFDPASAMLYWAQALAYGPNINDLGYAASPEALAATDKARQLSGSATILEKELIEAMSVRYTADSADVNRAGLNKAYTTKMAAIREKFSAHPDVAALYADAMMLEHPWDLWNNDGSHKPWTPGIQTVLEKLLVTNPGHPGANHYYIHVMEASPFAAKAIPSADRLGQLTPGLSHTIHMPSHIYLRTGNYSKGIAVNETAVSSYQKMIPLYEPVTGNAFLYSIHNLHMQTNHTMLAGRSGHSSLSAKETMAGIPADYLSIPGGMGNYIQYLYMTPVLVNVRFGNWNQLLLQSKPTNSLVYANILYHFGRGMALSHRTRLTDAKTELEQLQRSLNDSSLYAPFTPFSPAINGALVAEHLLSGTIALQEKKTSEAIAAFEKAVTIEENMVYSEPRDWMLNPKHYLGNAYIRSGRYGEALQTLRKDLLNNNENGWALFGCWQALTAQKKKKEAAGMLARFRKAFDRSDIKLDGPVF